MREGDAEQHQLLEPELGAAVVAREARAPVPVRAVQRPDVRHRDRPPLQVDGLVVVRGERVERKVLLLGRILGALGEGEGERTRA